MRNAVTGFAWQIFNFYQNKIQKKKKEYVE